MLPALLKRPSVLERTEAGALSAVYSRNMLRRGLCLPLCPPGSYVGLTARLGESRCKSTGFTISH